MACLGNRRLSSEWKTITITCETTVVGSGFGFYGVPDLTLDKTRSVYPISALIPGSLGLLYQNPQTLRVSDAV